MKFTDGFWLVRPGIKAHHPAEAYDAEQRDGHLLVYAPVKRVTHRGDTLNASVLTIDISAPATDVLKVRISHHIGGLPKHPDFPLTLSASPGDNHDPVLARANPGKGKTGGESPAVDIRDDEVRMSSGRLTASIRRGQVPWRLEFLGDGIPLTASELKGMGYIEAPDGKTYVHEQLSLGVGESVYGLGERFSAFVKNGQVVDIWNKDGGTSSEQTYKNVPFYLTDGGYGVFVNHPELVSFEVASEKVSRVQFSVEGQYIEYFIFFGPDPKAILRKYTALTGRPALPPLWSFGLWLTSSFTTAYDEATVNSFIQGMADRDLPLSVFHFDCFWMKEFNWTDFTWDSRTFPDPAAMLDRLKKNGLRICLWINPYIAQRSKLFDEGAARGYLLKKTGGGVWQTDLWQAGMGIVDFTNPAACSWYAAHLEALLDMGVDAFKTDFGERIPTDGEWFDGSDTGRMHNFYPYLYNKTVFDLLRKKRGEGEAVVFARSATAGCQKFPVHWGGDCDSTFPSMAESLRGGLSLGLSGFGFWSHDIGGFEGTPPAALYKRWIAFGLLSSHSRLHGSSSYRVPWVYGEDAVEVLRHFTRLKNRLMPTIFGIAAEAVATGIPVMRAMLLEFPADHVCKVLDRQYMLGSDVLVAPVFSEEGRVAFYLPAGDWTHILTGKKRSGPAWFEETYDYLSLPLFARQNAVLAFGLTGERPDYDWTRRLVFKVYALADGRTGERTIVDGQGRGIAVFRISRHSNTYTAELTPIGGAAPIADSVIVLVGEAGPARGEGGSVTPTDEGLAVVMEGLKVRIIRN